MTRRRVLTGERLSRAHEWYAQYRTLPRIKAMAARLGVSAKTLMRAVTRRTA